MTSVKIIKEVGAHDKGDVVNLAPGAAAYLINAGYAEKVDSKADQPKRARRTTKSDDTPTADE